MGLRLIYGKAGSGKTAYCFSEIAKIIEKDKDSKIYIITPEQFSYTAERNLMETIKEDAVINAEVITLSRMAYRVINEVGGQSSKKLSKCGRAMLVYSILAKNKGKLKYLSKSDENIDLSISTINEFKKHGITLENLKTEIDKIDDIYLKTKLEDMFLVYENFENMIEGNYIDEEDLLTYLAKNISSVDLVKDSYIYIDEFSGFTKQEYDVLKEIIKLAKEVNITICIDKLEYATNPDEDVYYSNKITLGKLVNLVDENNLKLEEPINLENQYRFKTNELKFLSENISNVKSTKYEEKVDNIKLFLAQNQYSEIENVAKEIRKLVENENLRYRDISIITKNISQYSSLVRAIFDRYDIPVFIDEKRDLNQNIIVQYVLSILDIIINNFSLESVLGYIKLGFCDIDKDEIFKLENYCIKWGIKQNKWKKDFIYETDRSDKKQEIERLNEIRKQVIEPLVKLQGDFKQDKTASGITKLLYSFLQNQDIENKLNIKIKELEEKGLVDLVAEYKNSYEIIINIFDDIFNIFKDEEMTIDRYSKIFKVGLKNNGLGKIPGTQDQIIFGDVDRSRSHKVNTVFIIGLNDGSFPSNNKDEGFLNDSDRNTLKEDGIELAKDSIENLYEDNFNIYKAFSTAENRIYLSYSSTDGDGKALRPSILINRIKKMFKKLEEKSDVVEKNYEIVNKPVTYEELIENIAKLNKEEKINDIWYQIYAYYKSQNEWNEKLQDDLEAIKYTNLPRNLQKENVSKLYGNTLKTSISKLERYRSCPFSYYLQYGLGLKEKEELKVKSFNTGSFMHETIDEFFKEVREEKINLAELTKEKIEEIVSDIVDKNIELPKNYIFISTAKYKILTKRLKRIISKALKYIIETLIYSDFNIAGTEVEFGSKGKYEPIILNLEDGKNIEITGKIDRIDIAENEDGKFLRIIDYKSSAKNIDLNEVYMGLQIQLLTYTDAICEKEDIMPAGVFYFSLLDQMIKTDKRISEEEIEDEIRKSFKMKGLIVADVKIIQMNDKNLKSGSSKMVPAGLTTSGEINKRYTNGIESEKFKILQKYIDVIIKQIGKEILSGKIDINPYNKKGRTLCKYCSYRSICGFNPQQENNTYNFVDDKSKDEIIEKMKNDIEKA